MPDLVRSGYVRPGHADEDSEGLLEGVLTTATHLGAGPVARRHAARLLGAASGTPLVLGHGFGTDSTMWGRLLPAFEASRPLVLFDHVGAGASDLTAHRPARHATLHGYAADLVELLDELDLGPVHYVGHSAGAMIGLLAAVERPELFRALVLIGGSPRYLDDDGYRGGFTRADVDGVLEAIESNYLAWARTMAPVVMGNAERPELAEELTATFARADSRIAARFARAIFLSDHRASLGDVRVPALVVQPGDDPMVPAEVGEHLAAAIPGAQLVRLRATGHFPHLSGPDETAAVLRRFLDGS